MLENVTISKHAKERYAERILNKSTNNEIQSFIIQNEDKIQSDINKMITYGDLLFSGKQLARDGKGNIVNAYLKDTWVVLVDSGNDTVITLFKIDLGCGDDFNNDYISRMIEKIDKAKDNLENMKIEVLNESNKYRELIDSYKGQINEYKTCIKNLEELNDGYEAIISGNAAKISQANREVADLVNTLIGKKEF